MLPLVTVWLYSSTEGKLKHIESFSLSCPSPTFLGLLSDMPQTSSITSQLYKWFQNLQHLRRTFSHVHVRDSQGEQ